MRFVSREVLLLEKVGKDSAHVTASSVLLNLSTNAWMKSSSALGKKDMLPTENVQPSLKKQLKAGIDDMLDT